MRRRSAFAFLGVLAFGLAACTDTSDAPGVKPTVAATTDSTTAPSGPTASATPSATQEPAHLVPIQRGGNVVTEKIPAPLDQWGGISIGADGVAGSVNEGKPVVRVYSDYWCPWCNDLVRDHGEELIQMAKDGKITLVYHPNMRFEESPYSVKGEQAEVWFAVNAPDKYLDFHELLYKEGSIPVVKHVDRAQRQQPDPALIEEFATRVGLDNAQLESLRATLAGDEYLPLLKQLREQFLADGMKYIPAVVIDEKLVSDPNNGNLDQFLAPLK
ncbi:DsbA family protein [Actinotignum schaalii]|uniref:DsbA family protein n=1 Tax=Actinotignum schaalii TaxID=59505 RepID=UPI00373F3CAD